MWRLIFHGISRRRWQSIATIFGVALGVSLLLTVLVLHQAIAQGLERGKARLGADLLVVPFHARVDVDEALFSGSPLNVYMDQKWEDVVRKIPGVRHVEAQFFTQTLALECCAVGEEIRLVGIEPSSVSRFALMSPDGEQRLGSDEIIAGGQLIARLGWKGSSVELLGDVFRIAFQLESTGTGLDESILMPIASARRLAANSAPLQPVWKEAGSPDRLISALLIEVDDPAHIDSVAESLDKVSDLRVLRPAEAFQRIKQSIGTFSIALAAAGFVTVLVSVVHLFSHIAAVAWDRKGEWALYRALGATRARLFQLMVGEALALSLGGAVFGLPLGAGLYHFALSRLLARNAFPIAPPGPAFLAAISLAAFALYGLIGLAAAIGPAVRIARLQPALIMAQGDIDP